MPVLFGGVVIVDMDKQAYWNAAVLATKDGKVLDMYGKMHPVPFAESIPFYEVGAVRAFFRNVVGIWNPWVEGTRYTVFRVPLQDGGEMAFGVPICFEDAFADLCRQYLLRGADLLVNITNDSWSKTWSSEIQHFQVARFRAIENRRVLVRSTNGGVSAVVGPWGEIRVRMPFFERTWRRRAGPAVQGKDPDALHAIRRLVPAVPGRACSHRPCRGPRTQKKRPSDPDDLSFFEPEDLYRSS